MRNKFKQASNKESQSGERKHAATKNGRSINTGAGANKKAAVKAGLEKTRFHARNTHKNGYKFKALCKCLPELSSAIVKTVKGHKSINFSDANSVKLLNQALLKHDYQIDYWDIPEGYLCPAIPGRADYLHYLADILALANKGKIPRGKRIKVLDVGMGANCVYPLIGHKTYGWAFVGSDIDKVSVQSASHIVEMNKINTAIDCRFQTDAASLFSGVIKADERFDVTLCNPPFHASLAEAEKGNIRKQKNLAANRNKKMAVNARQVKANQKDKSANSVFNFSGQGGELWCEGGELAFLTAMIAQSQMFSEQCLWFTSLISKQENIKPLKAKLKLANAQQVQVIDMLQGQKKTRVLAWSFYTEQQQQLWAQHYW